MLNRRRKFDDNDSDDDDDDDNDYDINDKSGATSLLIKIESTSVICKYV